MNCPACNTTVPSDAQFCPHCGKPLPTLNDATANRPAATVDQTAQQMLRRQALADEPERELWEGSYSSQAMLGAWILTIVGTIAGVVAATYMPDLWIFVIVGAPLVWLLLLTKLIYRRLSEQI